MSRNFEPLKLTQQSQAIGEHLWICVNKMPDYEPDEDFEINVRTMVFLGVTLLNNTRQFYGINVVLSSNVENNYVLAGKLNFTYFPNN